MKTIFFILVLFIAACSSHQDVFFETISTEDTTIQELLTRKDILHQTFIINRAIKKGYEIIKYEEDMSRNDNFNDTFAFKKITPYIIMYRKKGTHIFIQVDSTDKKTTYILSKSIPDEKK